MNDFVKWRFTESTSTGLEISHDVYEKGEGPVILLLQELPGIDKTALNLTQTLVAKGFKVVLPHLFGRIGKRRSIRNLLGLCISKEFHLLSKNESSPITDWLRKLGKAVCERDNVQGLGAIGMCITGNFALSMMLEERFKATVAAQPSMPIKSQESLHMSPEEISMIKTQLIDKGPAMAIRYERDRICKAAKFNALRREFNGEDALVNLIEIPGKGHSTLAGDLHQPSLDQVIQYFKDRLM